MATTDVDIVNEALFMVDQRIPLVTGASPTFDNTPAGKAAQVLYVPTVRAVARMFEWDMARHLFTMVKTPNNPLTFPPGWFEYFYPTVGVEVWQVIPAGADPDDPLPTTFMRANQLVNGVQTAVIQTDVDNAIAYYNNNPLPASWDPGFQETVVRMLASKFAASLSGRPETEMGMLQTSGAFGQGAMKRET